MDITIYVADEQSARAGERVIAQVGALPDGYQMRVVDITTEAAAGIPAQVLRAMSDQPEALPLTVIGEWPKISGHVPTLYELLSLLPDDGTHPALVTRADSGVEFSTPTRLHLSVNVVSIERVLPFYTTLFGAEPARIRPLYAKYELEDVPINFALNEHIFARPTTVGPVDHLGIELKSAEALSAVLERCVAAQLQVEPVAGGLRVADPEGNRWEVSISPRAMARVPDAAADFTTPGRPHLFLNVSDMDASLAFYRFLFRAEPSAAGPEHATFELEDPPMRLTLDRRPFERADVEGVVGHLGVQVKSSDVVQAAKERHEAAGHEVLVETLTACCYAVQTKIWVHDPDGNRWEVFVTTEPDATVAAPLTALPVHA